MLSRSGTMELADVWNGRLSEPVLPPLKWLMFGQEGSVILVQLSWLMFGKFGLVILVQFKV